MPIDQTVGYEVAAMLIAANVGDVGIDVYWTYDPFRLVESIDADSFVLVVPDTVSETKEGHQSWATKVTLAVHFAVRAEPTDLVAMADALDDWDAVIDIIKDHPKADTVERDTRFDQEHSQNHARIIATAMVGFSFFE